MKTWRIFILLVLFVLPISAMAEQEPLEIGKPFQYAVCESGVWIHLDGQLSFYDADNTITSTFSCDGVQHLAASGDKLYLHVQTDNGQLIRCVSEKGDIEAQWDIPRDITVNLFDITQDGVIILGTTEQVPDILDEHDHGHYNFSVYWLSFNRQTIEKLSVSDWDNSNIVTFAADGNTLCAISGMSGEMVQIDIQKRQIVNTHRSIFYNYIYMDQQMLYGLQEDGYGYSIEAIDLQSGERCMGDKLPVGVEHAGLRGNKHNLYVEDISRGRLIPLSIPENRSGKETKLTIIASDGFPEARRLERTMKLFHEDYPDVKVVFRNDMDSSVLATALMAKDPDLDIITVDEHGAICTKTMMKAGALLDLNTCPEIIETLSDWIDLDGIFVEEGMRFGVPEMIMPYFWKVNESLFKEMGLDVPKDDWTWMDFFALCEKVDAFNKQHGRQYYALTDTAWGYILTQYDMNNIKIMKGVAEFDNQQFRTLMGEWKTAFDNGVIYDGDIGIYGGEALEEIPALFWIEAGTYGELENYRHILPPKLSGDTRYPVDTVTLAVNKNSPNAELAVKFIACHLSAEAMSQGNVLFEGRYLQDINRYSFDWLDERYTLPSETNEQYWETLLGQGVQETFFGDIMYDQTWTFYPQFMEGKISVDEFATAMQNRADMAMGE